MPAYDAEGRHWSNQVIRQDSKLFAKDGRKEGCFHVVGGQEGLKAAPAIVIAEGYATAATVTEAIGFPAVAAFDAGNLKPVAESLAKAYPGKPVIIAGDDDYKLEGRPPHINRGRTAAEEAAKAVGGRVVLPLFAQADREAGLTDFNDLATRAEHTPRDVAAQIGPVVRAAAAAEGQGRGDTLSSEELAVGQEQERKPRAVRISA